MTATLVPEVEEEERVAVAPTPPTDEVPVEVEPPVSLRPVVAAALSSSAAALVVGGIFGSWSARLIGELVVVAGAALAAWVIRSRRPAVAQLVVLPAIALVALLSVLPSHSPADISRLVHEAVDAGRLLRPPVPFDPGWRPLFVLVLGLLSFGAAWIGAAMDRPLVGVVLPIPLVGLAAITQPDNGEILAGVFAFLPILAALGVLFGADRDAETELDRSFEITRLARGAVPMLALGVALVVLGNTGFLFPKPVFNPDDRPQKPKSIPLSQANDRVLFTVNAPDGFTGPWRTGVLDLYENGAWKLPGASALKLVDVPADGTLDDSPVAARAERADVDVALTTGDLGPTAVLPVVPTARHVRFAGSAPSLKLDRRTGGLRVPSGRAPSGLTYTLTLPAYPLAKQLEVAQKVKARPEEIAVPPAPVPIQRLLAQAPQGPWARLDFVRHKLLDHVVANGGGAPKDIDAKRVVDLLQGSKKGTPYEIVAAQALLARWAGIPARIGYGFNGVNDENGAKTVRPKNAAQWLEVRFDGFGWVPLLDVPPKAQADLENKKQPDQIVPSDEIAVQIFVPVELDNPRLLFERVRDAGKQAAPFAGVLIAIWLLTPLACRTVRRRRREAWADELGPRARIAVAYAEFRDAAADLALGDPFATPIEFLDRVQADGEHNELAWLTARTLYGDLGARVTDLDAGAAEELSLSLRTRLRGAQPMQVRVVGFLSKSSLLRPYTEEVPNVRVPTPLASSRRFVVALPGRVRRALPRLLRRNATQRAALLLLVVVALTMSACGGSGAPTSLIGVRKVALDLTFKDEKFAKPLPTRVVVTYIPAPDDLIARLNPGLHFTPPRLPSFACTHAGPSEVPSEVATSGIPHPPEPGTYLYSNVGTIDIQGAVSLKLPYPPVNKVVVSDVKQAIADNPLFGPSATTTFKVDQQLTGTLSIIDTLSYDKTALSLVKREIKSGGSTSTLAPNPPVTIMSFDGSGATFQGAGVDVANMSALIVQGSVGAKQVVDACGTLIDTYPATTTEQELDVTSVSTNGTQTNKPTHTNYALQLGGIVVKRESHTQQVIKTDAGAGVVNIDVVSTLINPEPLAP